MKITSLEVDGFGIWNGLKLDDFSDGLNVFCGPNEAGKTTLMQFIRSILYGFSPERRRYFPPLQGGRPGGSLCLAGPDGQFEVSRHDNLEKPGQAEIVTLTSADGARQGEHLLKTLLSDVDEVLFNNVFTVGLRELQELGSLDDTEAAAMLFNLSVGLDSVPLVDVMRDLHASRNHILGAEGQPSEVARLLAERDKIREGIEELGSLHRTYGRLESDRRQLGREVSRLEEEGNEVEHRLHIVQTAELIRSRWSRRAELDQRLAALGPVEKVPPRAIEQLDAVNTRLEEHNRQTAQLKSRFEELRREAKSLGLNDSLRRLGPRIEALAEQESWIETLQGRIGQLEDEILQREDDLASRRRELGLADDQADLPVISTQTLASLRQPARALRQSRQEVEQIRGEGGLAETTARELSEQVEAGLAAWGEKSLTEAMNRQGSLVSQLRRRLQVDQRIDQMDKHQGEMEERSCYLIERQLLPVWMLAGMGLVFVAGAIPVLGLLFFSSAFGSLGWPLAGLGLICCIAVVVAKFTIERSNARRLDACHKQIRMLQAQLEQARQEREELDKLLPAGEGLAAARLEAAEKQLAKLEQLVPIDSRRLAAAREADETQLHVKQAEQRLLAARKRWRESILSLELPGDLSPKQVRLLGAGRQEIADLRRRLELCNEERSQRDRELEGIATRIAQLAHQVDLDFDGQRPVETLHLLTAELADHQKRHERYQVFRDQARKVRRKRLRYETAAGNLRRRRRSLLQSVGAEDEPEFRRQAERFARAESLRADRAALQGEIDAAMAERCTVDDVAALLDANPDDENTPDASLESRRERLQERRQTLVDKLRKRLERRGQLTQQVETLAQDRSPAEKQLELSIVQTRLKEAVHRWRVRAVACRMLDRIRDRYEHERQPETLRQASAYLDRLTLGRYGRVWTPLGEDVLRVDDARGNALPVEVLSRGTREQLFVALRLALADSFAQRGIDLPLVLDDVLVNFDVQRAQAAAGVLRDFAAAGHQVLVFTCHEHIAKLFEALGLQVNQLPANGSSLELAAVEETSGKGSDTARDKKKSKAKSKAKSKKQPGKSDKKQEQADEPQPAAESIRLATSAEADVEQFDDRLQQDDREDEHEAEAAEYEEEEYEAENDDEEAENDEEESDEDEEEYDEAECEEYDDLDAA